MARFAKPVGHLTQFCKFPEVDRVIRITMKRDLKRQGAEPLSAASPALRDLQVETDALAVDEDRSGVNQLLPSTVVLVAVERGEREKELHGLSVRAGAAPGGEMKRAAESQTVKLGIVFEVAGADQMHHMVVEGQRGETVTRDGRRPVASNRPYCALPARAIGDLEFRWQEEPRLGSLKRRRTRGSAGYSSA